MKTYPFYSALAHLKDFFDLTIEDDEFENLGMHAWDKIGNKQTAVYHYTGKIVNGQMDLPCNADIIEMVTAGTEDWQKTDNIKTENYNRSEIENYIESRRGTENILYSRGGMPKFTQSDGSMIFQDKTLASARIIYRGVLLDDDGLPYLNSKEKEAIATYCAWLTTFKKGMATQNPATIQIAQMLEQRWYKVCENARTPELLNQNDINDILNVRSSWNRKRYGVSFKLFQ